MGIRDKPISPGSPWQNCFAERLIGSIRRECADHVVALGEQQLRCLLRPYAAYYNETRTYRSLIPRRRVQFSGPDALRLTRSSAGCTTNTFEPEFLVNTGNTMEIAMMLDWSPYANAYDRVLRRTATYQALITDLLGSTGPLPLLRDHTVILDCGCGTGNLCRSISDLLPAATLVAVDSDPTMAEFFRKKLADRLSPVAKPGTVYFLEADLMTIFPWLTQQSLRPDYVFLVNVLYLVDDPAATLRMIAACLSPGGGELRLSNPDERTDLGALLRQLELDLAAAQQLDGLVADFAVLGGFNHERLASMLHRLSSDEICRLVRDAGFKRITHITHDHYAGQSLLLSASI